MINILFRSLLVLEVKVKLGNMLKPAMALFLICLIVTAALAFTYNVTKDIIDQRAALDAENARKEVLAGADSFREIENIENIIGDNPDLKVIKKAYAGLQDGQVLGYVFSIACKGYGGEMNITAGIDSNGKIAGVKIGDNSETPGLGSKATNPKFLSLFKDITPKEPLKIVKGKKGKPEEINAVSGATVTSTTIVNAVQAALDMSAKLENEGGGSSE